MGYKLNPFTGNLDIVGLTTSDADDAYVNANGDTMTGPLDMGTNAILLQDTDGIKWILTVNTDGSLQTSMSMAGNPIGLLLALTYP